MTGARSRRRPVVAVDVAEVEQLASYAAHHGPRWLHDEMVGEARLRVLEAIDAGRTDGLATTALRGAHKAMRESMFQASGSIARFAWESGMQGVCLSDPVTSPTWASSGLGIPEALGVVGRHDVEPIGHDESFGPTLDHLVDVLVSRGLEREAVVEALYVIADRAGDARPELRVASATAPRGRVVDLSAALIAERSGLDDRSCAALKVLVVGERPRPGRPIEETVGLLVRAHRGDDVWSDPRTERLIEQVVSPGPRLNRPWSRPAPGLSFTPMSAA